VEEGADEVKQFSDEMKMRTKLKNLCVALGILAAVGAQDSTAHAQTTASTQGGSPSAMGKNSSGGIGAQLDKTNGVFLVKSVIASSPAENAGIKAGLKIISINDVATTDMTLNEAVNLLRGVVGTTVTVEVLPPDGAQQKVSIVRADIAALMGAGPPVRHRLLDTTTGLLTVRGFGTNTFEAVASALADFEKQSARHVILDLRNNEGGLSEAAADVASLLIGKETPLWEFQKTGSKNKIITLGKREKMWNGDLLVLVNAKTYFAAELVASVCQTSGRAKIWGEATTGKVTSYNLVTKADGTKERVPGGEFLTATGERLQGRGVTPDVPLTDVSGEGAIFKARAFFGRPNAHD
jgi:carboxyl-terminal processing protease